MLRRRIQSSPRPSFVSNIVSVLAVIAIVYIVIDSFIFQKIQDKKNKENNRKECLKELNRTINGVVSDAFLDDDINTKAFVIYFTNGEKYINPFFLKSLNGYIQPGDSISKLPGAFKFEVYKQGNNIPIAFEDSVDCEHLGQ